MPREHKEGPTVQDLRVLLKTENVTIDALYNLFKEKPNLRGHFDDREELEQLCTDHMDENNALRGHHLIDNLYDHAYWHGYEVAESEVNEEKADLVDALEKCVPLLKAYNGEKWLEVLKIVESAIARVK